MLENVIIGAGPYGLSMAAHFRGKGLTFRIFGRPMDSWIERMPKGMKLKSEGFASNIYDPNGQFTLEKFCAERKIEYAHTGLPVRLETFAAYGLAFMERMVPDLEDKVVLSVERDQNGFALRLDDGEIIKTRRVILAVGITHYRSIPSNLMHLPSEMLSHSSDHHDLEKFRGRKVIVLGGGSSATDLAGLLHEIGAEVQLVARQKKLVFHNKPEPGKKPSLWRQIRQPQSGLGPGLKSRFYSNWPNAFHMLPESTRLQIVKTHLGPSGGWFIKDMVVGKVPLSLGYTTERAEVRNGMVSLDLRGVDGSTREVSADHLIAATGYNTDLDRLKFLSPEISSSLEVINHTPILSAYFESSIPGLYFVGVSAANSFGPLMRFAYGAGFAAEQVTKSVSKSFANGHALPSVPSTASAAQAMDEEAEVVSSR